MKIARHWIRETAVETDATGEKHVGMAWGWSADNVDEARRRARVSAERVALWLASGGGGYRGKVPPRSAEYLYRLDRPPREEIIQELPDAAGEVMALITRNVYGALCLNCRDLMFVDLDFGPPKLQPFKLLASLFGKKAKAPPAPDSEAGILDRVRTWCTTHREYAVRLYRTAAGFRLAIVDQPMRATDPAAKAILEELGSDPLYRRLCEVQECFRARLTPKPWRMNVDMPQKFPLVDATAEELQRQWLREYDAAAQRFATCQLVETLGPPDVDASLAALVDLHDSLSGVGLDLPLARVCASFGVLPQGGARG
jgi:hypothetical protein